MSESPRLTKDGASPEWDHMGTVRIVKTYHVALKGSGPHPDLVDWEAVAVALDQRIETHGDLPPDVKANYASVSSETEVW